MKALLLLTFAMIAFPLLAWSEPVCVTANKAHLRSGPGEKYPVSWTVSQHMPLLRISKKGGWSKVKDVDGETHWVNSEVLNPNVACAVVKTKTARLLTGPGSNYPAAELPVADKYTSFKRVDREGTWVLVQDDFKGQYWVSESNVWMPVMRAKITF